MLWVPFFARHHSAWLPDDQRYPRLVPRISKQWRPRYSISAGWATVDIVARSPRQQKQANIPEVKLPPTRKMAINFETEARPQYNDTPQTRWLEQNYFLRYKQAFTNTWHKPRLALSKLPAGKFKRVRASRSEICPLHVWAGNVRHRLKKPADLTSYKTDIKLICKDARKA